MNFKKVLSLMMVFVLALGLVACGGDKPAEKDPATNEPAATETTETPAEESTEAPATDFDTAKPITVVTRDAASGTRGAFIEITGVEQKEGDNKVDKTTTEAVVQKETNGVLTAVKEDEYAIGYISLGSLNEDVTAIKVEGVEPTEKTVGDKSYPIQRPFLLVYKEEGLDPIAKDLLAFALSEEGQNIAVEEGYVKVGTPEAYTPAKLSGQITVSGSTSVTPLMEKFVEAYKVHNPEVTINIQSNGSSVGIQDAISGNAQIGMSSRELKDEEASQLAEETIAMDGIAVIVNKANPLNDLTMEQIKNIYIGDITMWSEVE